MRIEIIEIIFALMLTMILSGCFEGQDNQKNTENNITQNIVNIDILEDKKNVMVNIAKNDAIKRFNLSEDSIEIKSVIPVEWMDTSLGYPEPGKEIGKDYPVETIEGYVIIIRGNGKLYEYHSDYYRIVFPTSYIEEIPMITNVPNNGI